MKGILCGCGLATLLWLPLSAQQLRVGGGYAFIDYREQATFLHFSGSGPAATLEVERGRFALRAASSLESFTADQFSVRVGVRTYGLVAIEAGWFQRSIAPSRAAQSYSALTLGLRAAYPLAPGADVALRTAYVAGNDFTGGGSAPFGIELGLAAAYGPGSGRFRVTGDFDFQRIDRKTDGSGTELSVPIQSSVARLGLEVKF
jgi:hypothetical protein